MGEIRSNQLYWFSPISEAFLNPAYLLHFGMYLQPNLSLFSQTCLSNIDSVIQMMLYSHRNFGFEVKKVHAWGVEVCLHRKHCKTLK